MGGVWGWLEFSWRHALVYGMFWVDWHLARGRPGAVVASSSGVCLGQCDHSTLCVCVQVYVLLHCGMQGSRSLLVSIACEWCVSGVCVCVCACMRAGVHAHGCHSWLRRAGMLTITDFIHILRHHYKSPIVSPAPLVGQPSLHTHSHVSHPSATATVSTSTPSYSHLPLTHALTPHMHAPPLHSHHTALLLAVGWHGRTGRSNYSRMEM